MQEKASITVPADHLERFKGEAAFFTLRHATEGLFASGVTIAIERLHEAEHAERRPSEVVHRKARTMELFESLLDEAGWPDTEEGRV